MDRLKSMKVNIMCLVIAVNTDNIPEFATTTVPPFTLQYGVGQLKKF